jgi:hypothetical protein
MLFLHVIIKMIMDKDISEKTRVSLGLPSLITIVGSTFSLVIAIVMATWSIHSSLSDSQLEQQKVDDIQNSNIKELNTEFNIFKQESRESSLQINNKLDKIIDKQDVDHDRISEVVVTHKYLNLNKVAK